MKSKKLDYDELLDRIGLTSEHRDDVQLEVNEEDVSNPVKTISTKNKFGTSS